MRVYLAAPYAARDALRGYVSDLARLGHTCTSSWLNETTEIAAGTLGAAVEITDAEAAAHVRKDLVDVARSEVLVVWTWAAAVPLIEDPRGNSGGRHVETGAALAKKLPVIIIGEPENIFHRAEQATCVPDWHEACLTLADIAATLPRVEAS